MAENYNRSVPSKRIENRDLSRVPMDQDLHSLPRRLIELRIEHADRDELVVRRLKKRRLQLRDMIAQLESQLEPPEPA